MLENVAFTYDGVSSEDMGVMLINSGSGLFKEPLLANRSIVENQVAGRSIPYFKTIEEKPLAFPLTIFIRDWQKRDNLREIVRWLNQRIPKPFWFGDSPNRIMYGLIEGSPELLHNGCKEGYITVNFRTMSPYMYSQPLKFKYQVRGFYETYINNDGDETFYPFLTIDNLSGSEINIKTFMEDKPVNDFKLTGLLNNETIEVDCQNQNIKSEFESNERYLFDNHNDDWIEFQLGYPYNGETSTKIQFFGNFDIILEYQMKYRTM